MSSELVHPRSRLLLQRLPSTRDAVSNLTPNWFAAVMGTGIVATAAASLPLQPPGLRTFAVAAWVAAALLLVVLLVATGLHWAIFRSTAVSHHRDPVMAHFYGAPPMALLTVGAGTLLVGRDVLGLPLAVGLDWVLWSVGTALGLVSALAVPYLTFTRLEVGDTSPFGGWLMPVVPPMVSAATGALLIPHAPAGQARLTLLLACAAMFGISLIASVVVITLLWGRLARHKTGTVGMVPTLWIVLGPLGQSVTAAGLLATGVASVSPGAAAGARLLGVAFGAPVLGFALLWAGIALAITVRAARDGLPFSLTWWSFTFPVGTCVTGATQLALHTGSVAAAGLAVVLFIALLAAWGTVAARTVHGGLITGSLLMPKPVA